MAGDAPAVGGLTDVALPVARVAVDSPLPHLDRPFDYLVPVELDAAARPGVRVRVRFSGRLTDGWLLERVAASDHPATLARLERVLGTEAVLTPAVAALARAVADRWAGTLSDVLRLAVPPRHATAERRVSTPAAVMLAPDQPGLDRYAGGPDLLARLAVPRATRPAVPPPHVELRSHVDNAAEPPIHRRAHAGNAAQLRYDGRPVRAVWSMLPGAWAGELAAAVATVVATGAGAVVVVPDARDIGRVGAALAAAIGADAVVELAAGLGPAERYRRFLRVLRGAAPVVVGTRAAVWAPVARLGLVVVWDDGDDLLAEPRAPYPHARDVAALRSHLEGTHFLLAGHTVTVEAQHLVETGWAAALDPTPGARTAARPLVRAAGDEPERAADPLARAARLPSLGWRTAHTGLAAGPVLVQVPRRGYLARLACARCRTPARCPTCNGPVQQRAATVPPDCLWCGRSAPDWHCGHCGAAELRATVVGARRTAEELGRAFPGIAVRTSGGDAVLDTVPSTPALVISTPGAEPVADGGYAAALLLDGWALLGRPDLRAAEEALRRWTAAVSLVRPAAEGGAVVVVADGELPVTQALIAGRPRALAERELADRRELHLPPAARMAALTGQAVDVAELVGLLELPPGAELLGPVDDPDPRRREQERLLVRVPVSQGPALAATLRAATTVRSARRTGGAVRVVVDPVSVG